MSSVSVTLAAAAAEQLGGAEAVGREVRSDADMAMAVGAGFKVDVIDVLKTRGITDREIGELIIKPRTLSHRRANRSRLTVEESDRAARVARAIAPERPRGPRRLRALYPLSGERGNHATLRPVMASRRPSSSPSSFAMRSRS